MALEKVILSLAETVSNDPLMAAIEQKKIVERDEAIRKELDYLLSNGWKVVSSAVMVTPATTQQLVMILYKDDNDKLHNSPQFDKGVIQYLQPVWDDNQ